MPIFFHVDIKNIQCESGKFKIGKPCVPGGLPAGQGLRRGGWAGIPRFPCQRCAYQIFAKSIRVTENFRNFVVGNTFLSQAGVFGGDWNFFKIRNNNVWDRKNFKRTSTSMRM